MAKVKLADSIQAALPYLEKSFTDQPLIEARLRRTLGASFVYLGKPTIAEQQFRRVNVASLVSLSFLVQIFLQCFFQIKSIPV